MAFSSIFLCFPFMFYCANAQPPVCKVEAVFLWDRTYFTSHTYDVYLTPFIEHFQNHMPPRTDLHAAFVEFASRPKLLFGFSDMANQLDAWILSTEDLGANLDVAKATAFVWTSVLSQRAGKDPSRPVFLVFFVGNSPSKSGNLEAEIARIRRQTGAIVVAGFGAGYNRSDWLRIAASPSTFIEYDGNEILSNEELSGILYKTMCPQLVPPKRSAMMLPAPKPAPKNDDENNDGPCAGLDWLSCFTTMLKMQTY